MLAIDRRTDSPGPGFHALIIGISDYTFLPNPGAAFELDSPFTQRMGIYRLSAAARSAWELYQWLLKARLSVPLKTCRLLLAPSAHESDMVTGLAEQSGTCNLDDFLTEVYQWRRDAEGDPANVAFFYFCGQGFEVSSEPLLVLQDFGKPVGPFLRNTVSVSNLVNGMAPSSRAPNIARTQLYFVDTCRHRQESLRYFEAMNSTAVFDAEVIGLDDRSAPIFYAAAPGDSAFLIPHEYSVFSKALIECLQGAAAVHRTNEYGDATWVVSVSSLVSNLPNEVKKLLSEPQVRQEVTVSGAVRDAIICCVDTPPPVEVSIEVDPSSAAGSVTIQVRDAELNSIVYLSAPDHPYPYRILLRPGLYVCEVKFLSGERFSQSRFVSPPRASWKVRIKE
jgi:hypothetical protein